tara:strand:- start:6785 stop:9991 length:3207 start_codon:yes stop_codon:yes gene_type:complete
MAVTSIDTKDSIEALRLLITEFKGLQGQTKNTAKTFTELQNALSSLSGVSSQTNSQFSALQNQLKNSQKSQKNYVTQTRNLKQETALLNAENKKLEAQLRRTQSQSKKTGGAFGGLLNSTKSLLSAFGVIGGMQIFASIVRDAFATVKAFDSLNFTLKNIAKTNFDLTNSWIFLRDISDSFGLSILEAGQRYAKFLAAAQQAGLTLSDTEKIFRSMSKASAVLGLKTDELRGVYLALEQMLSKGKVTTEELRRQLGERLPGAVGLMAASMGVGIAELDKMLKKGEVIAREVLPDFAEAVEAAFGEEVQGNIETLQAKTTRLGSAWDLFIKALTEGDSVIKSSFELILNYLTDVTKGLEWLLNSENRVNIRRQQAAQDIEKSLEKTAREAASSKLGIYKNYEELRVAIALQNQKASTSIGEKEKEDEQAKLNALVAIQKEYLQEVKDVRIDYASENIKDVKAEYEATKVIWDKLNSDLKDMEKEQSELSFYEFYDASMLKQDRNNQEARIEDYRDTFALIAEEYRSLMNTLQTSNIIPVKPEKGDVKQINLKAPKDLQAQINVNKLQSSIKLNELLLESDETLMSEKQKLIQNNAKYEIEIARILAEDKKTQDKQSYDEEIAALDENKAEKKVSEIEYNNQIFLLGEELKQKKELAELEYNEKIRSAKKDLSDNTLNLLEQENEIALDIIRQKYDNELSELNKTYEEKVKLSEKEENIANKDKILAKAWEDLEIGKRDVSIKMYNEIIDAQILVLENQIEIGHESEESIAKIQRAIDGLKATKKNLEPGGENKSAKDIEKEWQQFADMVGDALFAVADISQALSDRKLEAINAEIVAEENKYDRLLKLAENDASRTAVLQEEKASRIEALEAKRLEQEQRAAKMRKAFAIADIAMTLAQTLMQINLAAIKLDTKIPGTGIAYSLVQKALAIGTALAQTTAVLATPIPQYKDGVENLSNDQVAMINDGGKKEYVERNGSILSTDTKNAIVGLKKGDTVHKDYDSMKKNSMIYSLLLQGQTMPQSTFDSLSTTIENSINKGFNKAKINNNIKLVNRQSSNNYLNKKSRFNG